MASSRHGCEAKYQEVYNFGGSTTFIIDSSTKTLYSFFVIINEILVQ